MSKNIILVMGRPNTGKTASMRNLPMKEVAYLSADLTDISCHAKDIKELKIKDARKVPTYIKKCEANDEVNYIVLDTLTSLMGMFERQHVVPKAGTKEGMSAWGDYGNFYGDSVHALKAGKKHTIVFAHDEARYDEDKMEIVSKVPIKGAVGKIGSEKDFSVILTSRLVSLKELEPFENPWLNITEDELFNEKKYVFQTKPYKGEGSMSRTPMGMFDRHSVFIDNDVAMVIDLLQKRYEE
jgi:hypothetical protein